MTDSNELTELRAEVAEMSAGFEAMRSELAALQRVAEPAEAESADPVAEAEPPIEIGTAVTRRNWMKAAAVAAVGGTAAALGSAERVAADDTDPILIGQTNNVGDMRTVASQNPNDRPEMSFLFETDTGLTGADPVFPGALGGATSSPSKPNGVYGYTDVNNEDANGVVGHSATRLGIGVRAFNSEIGGAALYAETAANGGIGAVARGGFIGLSADSDQYGVATSGKTAALLIGASSAVAPPDRATSTGAAGGALDTQRLSDSGAASLWFCTAPGAPGVWQKLAGPFTAGAFHAIDPKRVYDSRAAQPSPGALAAGSSRVVSVADGRDLDTGAVTRAGLVPEDATAITYNLTITATVGSGFVAVAPGSATTFGASAINWSTSGTTIANAGLVQLDLDRQVKVFAEVGATDFVIDVTGYYR